MIKPARREASVSLPSLAIKESTTSGLCNDWSTRNAPKRTDRRNEPALLPWVVQALAQARGQTAEHIAAISTRNAQAFFDWH